MFKLKKIDEPKFNAKIFIVDCLITILGTFFFASAVHIFTAPNQIAPGGITGISTIINYLTGLPIGAVNITLNLPIMLFGLFNLGKWFMVKTVISSLSFTIFIDYVLVNIPVFTGDKVLVAIFGGALMGIGIGTVLTRGGSTGGMDIINKSILKLVPHMKLGTLTLLVDLFVIVISIFAFKSIEPAFYAMITLFISSQAIDKVLYGFNVCKLMYVVSEHAEQITKEIIVKMNRGATILESRGAFTDVRKPTILCAVRQNEYFKVKKIIKTIDPNAFIMISSATEIDGSGFKSNEI